MGLNRATNLDESVLASPHATACGPRAKIVNVAFRAAEPKVRDAMGAGR
jgi:hypothetical protein